EVPPMSSTLVERPEIELELVSGGDIGDAARPLPLWQRVAEWTLTRRLLVLVLLGLLWQGYAMSAHNPLMLPSLTDSLQALWEVTISGEILARVSTSMEVLLIGYTCGIAGASVLTIFAVSTRFGSDVLSTLTAMFNPMPALALLPLALLWFG